MTDRRYKSELIRAARERTVWDVGDRFTYRTILDAICGGYGTLGGEENQEAACLADRLALSSHGTGASN
jgi:hypothetical protein